MNNIYCRFYDFLFWKQYIFYISIVCIFFSVSAMVMFGFNWGLDFTGGLLVEINLDQTANLIEIKNFLIQSGINKVTVQYLENDNNIIIRVPVVVAQFNDNIEQHSVSNILDILRKNINQSFVVQRAVWLGPSVSADLKKSGGMVLFFSLLCILIYIAFRFEWRLAVGAIVALIHDLLIILGVLSFLFIEINSTTIAALISAIGYSLNDEIIIFDRIRENFLRVSDLDTIKIFNMSLSQVFNRTIITSGTTVIVLLILIFLGGTILQEFAITLLFGVILGTISSIYVASVIAFKLGTKKEYFIKKNIHYR